MPESANRWELWETQIRQPAERTKEGKRRLQEGPASVEYLLATLPDGRWAVRVSCIMESSSGMSIPWRAFPSREECIRFFLEQAKAFFEREKGIKKAREAARRKMMELLEGNGLWGFEEPEPER